MSFEADCVVILFFYEQFAHSVRALRYAHEIHAIGKIGHIERGDCGMGFPL